MRVNTSELILEFIRDKDFTSSKDILDTISTDNEVTSESVRVALSRLEKSGNIEKKYEGRTKLFKYVSDLIKERELNPKKFARDYIFSILKGKTLTMEEVVTKVLKKFPDTSKGNIKTILSRESSKCNIEKLDTYPLQYTII